MSLIRADARLLPLRDGCVQTCVTSPPYFGLRDYGSAKWVGGAEDCEHVGTVPRTAPAGTSKQASNRGANAVMSGNCACGAERIDPQIGLEPSPDAYAQSLLTVFAEVWRVLKDDGTVWLNLGDSYASQTKGSGGKNSSGLNCKRDTNGRAIGKSIVTYEPRRFEHGVKDKDLLGIPWRVAFALQQPRYHGTIHSREDRIWLAAMLDAEGCMFIHKRKVGQSNGQGYHRQNDNFGPGVEIANTSLAVVERIAALVGKGSICSQGPEENNRRKQTIYRWNLRTTECRDFVREIYPYLVAKQQQARILCGCPSSGERAEAAHAALISLHRTGESSVDFPAPASLFSPGWYLRSDIIWSKCNPMPESVTDRPTKAHEYIFMLSKQASYYYDADAVAESAVRAGEVYRPSETTMSRGQAIGAGVAMSGNALKDVLTVGDTRNKRSVWHVATQPYSGSHFATFPEALIEPCILAGSRPGDLVLDPFIGSGTVGTVCERYGRRWVGTDIGYQHLSKDRTLQRGLRFYA